MSLNLGYFIIRKPRVSSYNAVTTLPPTSQGNYITLPCFQIKYIGSVSYAQMTITGRKLLTIIDENITHPDNLNIALDGKTNQQIISAINNNINYSVVESSGIDSEQAFYVGVTKADINNNYYEIYYNIETEYLIDVDKEGKLGSSSISWKQDNFQYSAENSKWLLGAGYIYDAQNIPIDSSGVANLDSGVQIKFFPALLSTDNDVNRTVTFSNVVLSQSLSWDTSQINFPGAPLLIPDTIELLVNNIVLVENINYKINYGTAATLISPNASPYTIPYSSVGTFRIRYDNDAYQEFLLPLGMQSAFDLSDFINKTAINFQAYVYVDTLTNLGYLAFQNIEGTVYHGLRVEDGTANSIFGFTDYQGVRGSGVGLIQFITPVQNEDITPTKTTNTLFINITQKNPTAFLGLNPDNFNLYENGQLKTKNEDYLLGSVGNIDLISIIDNEILSEGILKEDTELFTNDYTIYDNEQALVENTDYNINAVGGWITLVTSAFPNHVYTVTYRNDVKGTIINEVILGTSASITSTNIGSYAIDASTNQLILSIDNGPYQTIILMEGANNTVNEVVDAINNSSATGFTASISPTSTITLTSNTAGTTSSISVGNGSSNSILGFTSGQAISGTTAKGGERTMQVKYPPMSIGGFTAPQAGNTIIIKNMDVIDRYPPGSVIQLNSDIYQIENSYLDTKANIINGTVEPFAIITNTNDIFQFTIDGGSQTTVQFTPANNKTIANLAAEITAVYPDCAVEINLNGTNRLKIVGNISVVIGNGTANRTIGFQGGQSDTNAPDSVLIITDVFQNTYVNPTIYTTVTPVILEIDNTSKKQIPQNSTQIVFMGDVSENYTKDTLVKIAGKYFYTSFGASFANNVTTVTFNARTAAPIYTDTLIERSNAPIFKEGDTTLYTSLYPLLNQPYNVYNNMISLVVNKDFTINGAGTVILTKGMINGDNYTIQYVGRREIDSSTTVEVDYSYYSTISKGSSVVLSCQLDSPDNFYINVLYANTLMDSFEKDLKKQIQTTANPSNQGFPTGVITTPTNSDQGNESYYTTLGYTDDEIGLAEQWYHFFEDRLYYFENEKQTLNGYLVGAEDGRVTDAQIEDAANNPPTRLYPQNDPRSDTDRVDPYRVPALNGLNENDAGSSVNGWVAITSLSTLNAESTAIDSELTKLNTLSGFSTTVDTLSSTGGFNFTSDETMSLYVEVEYPSGTLLQNNVTVTFSPKSIPNPALYPPPSPPPEPPLPLTIIVPQTPEYVRDQINNAVNAAFGFSVNLAIVGVGVELVTRTDISGYYGRCAYILEDAPDVNFGLYNCVAIRSRHVLWTGGWVYSLSVPGLSVHTDIETEDSNRSLELSQHNTQLSMIMGQMEEWLSPYDVAYNLAKIERTNVNNWISATTSFIISSDNFDDMKAINNLPFTALDDISVINNRISSLNSRKTDISNRETTIDARITNIINILSAENLYDPRYSWVIILCNRESGLYEQEKRTIDTQTKNQNSANNNKYLVSSIDSM